MKFIDEDPEDKKEREAAARKHPHIVRLTDGQLAVAQELADYAKERHKIGTMHMSALEEDDLNGLRQALEDA